MDNEWVEGVWEHEIPFTTGPGTKWMWPRCFAVGGKTNFWGRSSARFGDIDFRAASLAGAGVDWPLEYKEIAPYYSRVERMIGVASTVQNRPSNPDGDYLPAFNFRCLDHILQQGGKKIGVPYLPDRIAQLTQDHAGSPACHFCGACTTGCETGSFFSTPWRFLPRAEASGNLELRINALAKNILVDENGMASGVAYIDRNTGQEVEVRARAVVVAATCRSCSGSRVFPTTSATVRLRGCRAGRISRNRTRRNSSTATRCTRGEGARNTRGMRCRPRASVRPTSARSRGDIRRRSVSPSRRPRCPRLLTTWISIRK
jgi:choline dehydrogenase-like flavoprotein